MYSVPAKPFNVINLRFDLLFTVTEEILALEITSHREGALKSFVSLGIPQLCFGAALQTDLEVVLDFRTGMLERVPMHKEALYLL